MVITKLIIVAEQILLYVPLVFGAYLSFSLLKLPDLAIEAAYLMGAVATGALLSHTAGVTQGLHLIAAISVSLLGGCTVGLVSGLMTTVGRLPHLLSSIIAAGIFHGVGLYVMGSSTISVSYAHTVLNFFGSNELISLLLIGLGAMAFVCFIARTQLGYAATIYGINPHFFAHHGISDRFVLLAILLFSSALAGLSGGMVAQAHGFADILMGTGTALQIITALALGRIVVRNIPSFFQTASPLIGLVLSFIMQQLLLVVGFDLKYFMMVQSLVVMAVFIAMMRQKKSAVVDHIGLGG